MAAARVRRDRRAWIGGSPVGCFPPVELLSTLCGPRTSTLRPRTVVGRASYRSATALLQGGREDPFRGRGPETTQSKASETLQPAEGTPRGSRRFHRSIANDAMDRQEPSPNFIQGSVRRPK